ncbi:MAG TPA: GNAT family N-acetyltransferase [Burkholderiaceae bacterium]|nr:GNAT family N-acetyltransferase [Burkholderiaceae bacterium]
MSRQDALVHTAMRATASRFAVRRLRLSDAEGWARTMAHPEVYPQLLQMPWGNADQWQARLTDMLAPGSLHVPIVAEAADGAIVGGAGLHPVGASPRKRHAMALGIHVDPAFQGQGVGALLMQSLCDYADRWLGLLRIELEVYADNLRAQALYKRFGFVQEGHHRCDAMRDGEYVDSLSMARLNPAPLRGFPRD